MKIERGIAQYTIEIQLASNIDRQNEYRLCL